MASVDAMVCCFGASKVADESRTASPLLPAAGKQYMSGGEVVPTKPSQAITVDFVRPSRDKSEYSEHSPGSKESAIFNAPELAVR